MVASRRQRGIRIIAGRWRGTRLSVPERAGLRPTSDRVRETLFNWLMPRIEGARCLDLFAGTGALGLEAASRGAAEVVLVERDPHLCRGMREVVGRLGAAQVRIEQADAVAWIALSRKPFDLVFLDPPFDEAVLPVVCDHLLSNALVAPGGWLYLEQPPGPDRERLPRGWARLKGGRTSQVRYDLLAPPPPDGDHRI